MEDISQLLNEVNSSVVYKKVRDLEINKKFDVKSMEVVKTPFGKRICVKCAEFQLTLPESWNDKLNHQTINKLNQTKLCIIYKGMIELPNNKTKLDIEFVV